MDTSINEGVLFEDTGDFLKWGDSTELLAKKLDAKIERGGDRTVYYWGEHNILNGLHLCLSCMYWKFGKGNLLKRFNEIGFWAIGDDMALKYLEVISNHLKNEFGEPQRKEGDMPDILYEWKLERVTLKLFLFEQFVYKLHFTISRN